MFIYKAPTTLRKMLLALVGVLGILTVMACSDGGLNLSLGSDGEGTNKVNVDSGLKGSTMRIAGATELVELQPLMRKASDDLGSTINLEPLDGTVKNSHALIDDDFDNQFDATWFATGQYVDLFGGADRLDEAKKVATSPVASGIHSPKARKLGWDTKQPTWGEIAEVVSSGKLTYGIINPTEPNSGFSGVVLIATAFTDTGSALTTGNINRTTPGLQKSSEGQKMTSGSSGWLRDKFPGEPGSVNVLINYEAVLQQMNKEGTDLEVVMPSDGTISVDYPLTSLAQPANDFTARQTKALGQWLEADPQILADHFPRPVSDETNLSESMINSVITELPFPGDRVVTDRLTEAYDNDLRVPGGSVFVLDTSGSMFGDRTADLQATMRAIVDDSAHTETGSVGLRNREIATILSFSMSVGKSTTTTIDGPEPRVQLTAAVDGLRAEGETALYDALIQAFDFLGSSDKNSIPSIMVLTDGQVISGKTLSELRDFHQSKGGNLSPVFVIRYGEADPGEMQELANLTGGRAFGSHETEFADVFKEIRGYQQILRHSLRHFLWRWLS